MTLLIACLLVLMLKKRPDWAVSRFLYGWLVAKPAAWLARLERKHLLFLIFGMFMAYGLAFTAPADLAMVMAWDFVAYLVVALAVWAAAAMTRVRAFSAAMKFRMSAILRRVRRRRESQRRTRAERRRPPTANDDDHPLQIRALRAA